MRVIIAQRNLSSPGGSETFVLTLAEHFAMLGHEVIVRALHLGMAADLGRERGVNIVREEDHLPAEADATIALDRVLAIELALRYPRATRLYAMHNADEIWLPPPEPGVVAATVAPNDRFAKLARGCAGAGEVVRMRQPIDLYRFSPRGGWAREKPARILLIGNYSGTPGQRIDQLQAAWSEPGLEWRRLGHPEPTTAVADAMADADIVVGYGRSILEAMSCGRPAYVHEHSGSDGWVNQESYARLEADGFAGTGVRPTPDLAQLREDFLRYDPALGQVGHDFVRTHHDARLIAAELIALIDRLGPAPQSHDPLSLRALRNLAESHFRADQDIHSLRQEVGARARELESERAGHRAQIGSVEADRDKAVRALAEQDAATRTLRDNHGVPIRSVLARFEAFRTKNGRLDRLRRLGRKKTALQLIEESIFFDPSWYLEQYPDVAAANFDPAKHYLEVGFKEGRDPGPCFSTTLYLKTNPDIVEAKHNPLVHYEKYGRREGRRGAGFD